MWIRQNLKNGNFVANLKDVDEDVKKLIDQSHSKKSTAKHISNIYDLKNLDIKRGFQYDNESKFITDPTNTQKTWEIRKLFHCTGIDPSKKQIVNIENLKYIESAKILLQNIFKPRDRKFKRKNQQLSKL